MALAPRTSASMMPGRYPTARAPEFYDWAPAPPPPFYSMAYPASRCIDGDLSTYCHGPQRHENPWLSIALADRRAVDRVEVYNRADCCYSRISPFEVWVGDAVGSVESWNGTLCSGEEQYPPYAASTGPFTTACGGAVGDHVTIRLPGIMR